MWTCSSPSLRGWSQIYQSPEYHERSEVRYVEALYWEILSSGQILDYTGSLHERHCKAMPIRSGSQNDWCKATLKLTDLKMSMFLELDDHKDGSTCCFLYNVSGQQAELPWHSERPTEDLETSPLLYSGSCIWRRCWSCANAEWYCNTNHLANTSVSQRKTVRCWKELPNWRA